jgi:hypothetical protein
MNDLRLQATRDFHAKKGSLTVTYHVPFCQLMAMTRLAAAKRDSRHLHFYH